MLGLASPRGAAFLLEALERKGYVERESTPRGIRLVDRDVVDLPLITDVASGTPLLAEENIEEYMPVSKRLVGGDTRSFLLRIRGDSMSGDHILDGDLVIVRTQPTAENGQIVVALLEDEATVRRFHATENGIRLEPSNPQYPVLHVTNSLLIKGIVIGVIREAV